MRNDELIQQFNETGKILKEFRTLMDQNYKELESDLIRFKNVPIVKKWLETRWKGFLDKDNSYLKEQERLYNEVKDGDRLLERFKAEPEVFKFYLNTRKSKNKN